MFLHLDTGMKGLGCIVSPHRNICLHNNLAAVHTGVNIMHRTTGIRNTCLQSLLPCLHPGEMRQNRRVNIQYPVRESAQEGLLHQTHKPGQTNKIDIKLAKLLRKTRLNIQWKLRLVAPAIHHLCPHPALASSFKNIGISVIRQNNNNLRRQTTIINSIENGLTIGAGAGA